LPAATDDKPELVTLTRDELRDLRRACLQLSKTIERISVVDTLTAAKPKTEPPRK
jgi:hypothetical protein